MNEEFRAYAENLESEILRGISTVCILSVISQHGSEGTYGYQLLKDLEEQGSGMLIIEEGTLYPMLKNLEKKGLVSSEKKEFKGRLRKYYKLTVDGTKIHKHLSGLLSKLIEAIAPMVEIEVDLADKYLYCPQCSNKMDLADESSNYCEICGYPIDELRRRLEEE